MNIVSKIVQIEFECEEEIGGVWQSKAIHVPRGPCTPGSTLELRIDTTSTAAQTFSVITKSEGVRVEN